MLTLESQAKGVLLVNTAKEKIAYLRGLLEGGNLYGKDPSDRVIWDQLMDILDDRPLVSTPWVPIRMS